MGKANRTPLLKLLGFAGLLGLVFVLAAGIGRAADLGESEETSDASGSHEEDSMETMEGTQEVDQVRGLSVSEDELTLDLETTRATSDEEFELRYAIRGADGRAITDFDVEHTKPMHLIVVRRDLTEFQHLHPEQAADGSWTAPATLGDPGTYRVFADFSVDGEPQTLGADLTTDGAVASRPLPPAEPVAEVDGLRVELERRAGDHGDELSFEVTRDGGAVEIEPYLGAQGHLVALREGDLAFLHVHPDEDSLSFSAEFPSAGRYRLFLQVKVDGEVRTVPFTVEIGR